MPPIFEMFFKYLYLNGVFSDTYNNYYIRQRKQQYTFQKHILNRYLCNLYNVMVADCS